MVTAAADDLSISFFKKYWDKDGVGALNKAV
jgi:hypothetical protein